MSTDSANNPHDAFFRQSLARPEILNESVRQWLPAELVDLIDFDSLEIEPDTFIDDELRRHQSDVLIRTKLLIDQSPILIYFLFEHKTTPDKWVALQTLRYMIRIWEKQRFNKDDLSPIIPIVFYHGDRRWNVPTEFQSFFKSLPKSAKRHIPNFEFILQDYSWRNQIDPNEIEGNDWYRTFLAVSHTIFDPHLSEKVIDLVALGWRLRNDQRGVDYFNLLLYYWVRGAQKMTSEALTVALNRVEQGQGDEILMTLAEMWIEQGIEKGIEKGIQEGIQEGIERTVKKLIDKDVMSLSEIASLLELPLSEVERISLLRKEL